MPVQIYRLYQKITKKIISSSQQIAGSKKYYPLAKGIIVCIFNLLAFNTIFVIKYFHQFRFMMILESDLQ